ncbi:hypothetical protein GOBAR_DD33881 [Gossypium barbadense]|nr:hypothetical protein GOBAR_DD33881 [Gossypium barbadense]
MRAGLKKDLRVFRVGPRGSLNDLFFLPIGVISYFTNTCHGMEEGGNKHTSRAQYNGELYAASLVQVQDGPAAPRKRIEEASDSFMHDPLGSGDIAQLVELRSCNWVVAITEVSRSVVVAEACVRRLAARGVRRMGRLVAGGGLRCSSSNNN